MIALRDWVGQFAGAGKLIGIALVLGLAAMAGGWLTGVLKDREIAELKRGHAEAAAKAERAASQRLAEAKARGDALTVDLHVANAAALRLQEQLHEEIELATQGRACLDAAALRVLDRAPGIAAHRVPAPARVAPAKDAPDPARDTAQRAGDERSATDTDIGRWVLGAGRQYDECVRRLDALIDWHTPDPEHQDRAPAWN